jgi:hypothetical protein
MANWKDYVEDVERKNERWGMNMGWKDKEKEYSILSSQVWQNHITN